MKLTAHLYNAQQAVPALRALFEQIKPYLIAGHRLRVVVENERRSLDQNAKLHALLGEVSKSVKWAGKHRDIETWKRLMTAAWLRARGESVEILPALDGHGVDVVFRHTSKLTTDECSELIEFVQAWADQHEAETCDA